MTSRRLKATSQELSRLRKFIEEICGIAVAKGKEYLIESRLRDLLLQEGLSSFGELMKQAARAPAWKLKDKIAEAMTTNETLWFRDKHPFRILDRILLPEYARQAKKGERREVRIWSAGCATGQEPYSIAITIHQFLRRNPGVRKRMCSIMATDLSRQSLQTAQSGSYDPIAMERGMPSETGDRYFRRDGKYRVVNTEIRRMVEFREHNLQRGFHSLGLFDVVFCRHVLIYFSAKLKQDILKRLCKSLKPGGCLFLGATEPMVGYETDLRLRESEGGIYYQKPPLFYSLEEA